MRKLLTDFTILNIVAIVLVACAGDMISSAATPTDFTTGWTHLSSANGDLAAPSNATQQTAALILDVDKDSVNDFVIGSRRAGPALVWYQRNADGWTKYLIDDATLDIEAGGAFYDIDGDGDLDVVMGGDADSNRVWWWENPYPNYDPDTPWTRRDIKNSGSSKHHDQIFGDFDGDGQVELVFWNQGAEKLFIADIPSDPKNTQPWSCTEIYSWSAGSEHEGLAKADIDGDGKVDIVGGGRWFKHNGGTSYTPHIIDNSQTFARASAGQLKAGGRPEVVFVVGDGVGRLKWYEWTGSGWVGHDLLGFDVDHGHSLEVADIDGDGKLDIFCAEMRLDEGNADAKMWVFLGDGEGNFTQTEVATGYGNHESKVGDLDGDGDLDILGKSYNWDTPRVDVWLNGGTGLSLDRWKQHVVDSEKPWQSIFITSADMDGDAQQDIITGGWWYKNPGSPGGTWTRHTLGAPLNNMAAVYDFDGDGDMDVLGTEGQGSEDNPNFVWARNDGSGAFTILDNVESGDGDFLQGVAVERFQDGGDLEVALSWHIAGKGVQRLAVPSNPSSGTWTRDQISPTSQDEALSAGDIDRDGDIELLLGTKWLRNDGGSWAAYILNGTSGDPDRNRLADINGDGRLDAVVGFETISTLGKLAWYEQGSSATSEWTEHVIANVIGPMSLDVADMDKDGDLDVVVGEHNLSDPSSAKLYVFENADSQGASWTEHVVYTGDEHHDGAQVVDIDGDGDLDIISIGWSHNRVLLYENKAIDGGGGTPTSTPTSTPTPTNTLTSTPTLTATATPADTVAPTPTPTATLTSTPTSIPTPTDTPTLAATATPTDTVTPTATPVPTDTPIATSTPTDTPTLTATAAPANTVTLTATPTPLPTDTPTPLPTDTPTPLPTDTPTPLPTDTPTPLPTDTPTPTLNNERVTDGLQAFYTFEEGSGITVHDVSEVGTPLDLSVSNEAAVSWVPGGLVVNASTVIASAGAATKVIDACQATNELTIEAWIKPASTTQDGPARVVTLSADPYQRNFTLGQGLWGSQPSDLYDVRLRTTATDSNGRPSLTTPAGSLTTELSQVVYTRDSSGVVRIYIDGVERVSGTVGGGFSNWDESYRLALANELTGDRPWLGEFHLVAIYNRALSQAEVNQNFSYPVVLLDNSFERTGRKVALALAALVEVKSRPGHKVALLLAQGK